MPSKITVQAVAKSRDALPDAADWGQLRSALAKAGVKQAEITEAIGGDIARRKRCEIVDQLRQWLKTRSAS